MTRFPKIKPRTWKYIGVCFFVAILLMAGWRFKWSSLDFSFVELAPPNPEAININYIPRVVFYDQFGDPLEASSGLTGGNLGDFSKILLWLSLQSKAADPIQVKFVSSRIVATNGDKPQQIYQSDLGQEFVIYPEREISVDVMNLNPVYLKEMSELNPGKKIDLTVTTVIEFPEKRSRKELDITCKNNANLVNQAYENNSFEMYYPSCLVTAERKI